MELVLIGLILTAIIVFVIPLAVLRAGIRRQDRAASLTCQPSGVSAALARRVLGPHARKPADADRCDHRDCEPSFLGGGKERGTS